MNWGPGVLWLAVVPTATLGVVAREAVLLHRTGADHPDRTRSYRRLRRIVVTFAAVHALAAALLFLLWRGLTWDPPPSAEAKERERLLVELRGEDLGIAGLHLLSAGSDAGRRAGTGDFQLGQEVSASLSYEFAASRDPVALCQLTVDRLVGTGWAFDELEEGCTDVTHFDAEPEYGVAEPHDAIYVFLTYAHPRFGVRGELTLRMDPGRDPSHTLHFVLETAYPD